MSVLWKNIEFYKGESDHEVMITAAGSLEGTLSHPVDSFFNYGGGDRVWGTPVPHQSKNDQHLSHQKLLFPLSESTPQNFYSLKVLAPPIVT